MSLASQISALASRIATEFKTLSRTEARIVGELISWPGEGTPPYGWLDADGSIKKKADWPELSTFCGTRFNTGFEAADEFRLPDWRGRVTVGLDPLQTEFDAVNEAGGAKTHTLTIPETPDHVHKRSFYNSPDAPGTASYKGSSGVENWAIGGSSSQGIDAPAGTLNKPHNNLQPYRVARILIRAVTSVAMPEGSTSIDAAQITSGTLADARLPARLQDAALDATYEASIIAGTTAQYWRGDKTWQTLPTYIIPTQAEAEAGTATTARVWTAQRVAQAIAALQAVKSVAGKTGIVTLVKGDVGLANVDNTSDAAKPISTATQTALNGKSDTGHNHDANYAAIDHGHKIIGGKNASELPSTYPVGLSTFDTISTMGFPGSNGVVTTSYHNSNRASQMWVEKDTGRTWMRTCNTNAWTIWVEYMTTAAHNVGARVGMAGGGPLTTHGAVTNVPWNVEVEDTDAFWTSGSPTRFTIPAGMGGRYLVVGTIGFEFATGFDQYTGIFLNSSEQRQTRNRQQGMYASMTSTFLGTLNAGDYVELRVYQASGGTRGISEPHSGFSIAKVG